MAEKDPESYLPALGDTLNNLGLLDSDQDRNVEARKEYEEALKIRRELAEKNREAYLPDVADTLNNLGLLDCAQNRIAEASQKYAEALQIYETVAKQNPERFSADVTRVKELLAKLPIPMMQRH